jgi:predicted ArsR family transcriptional regulator
MTAIGALGDPIRRALFQYVATQPEPVGREQAAAAVGVAHHVARFHLDRLYDAGLLEVEYKRPAGRGGPGAGRPTKLYRPTATEFSASVPERRYDIAGLVLARAMANAVDSATPVGQALERAARDAGHALGREAGAHRSPSRRRSTAPLAVAVDTLEAHGFSPRPDNGGYLLANCPFRALAQEEPDVVCRMNLAFVAGLLDEAGVRSATARLDPADDRCCVTVRP